VQAPAPGPSCGGADWSARVKPNWYFSSRIGSISLDGVLDLTFQPDRGSHEPLYRQLELHLRDLIEARRLGPAERLPASRALASALGLSRNTVNQAYQALSDAGLLSCHVGRGTFVSAGAAPGLVPRAGGAPARGFAWGGLLARRSRAATLPRALRADALAPAAFDFRGGLVDPGSLPVAELKRCFGRALERSAELARHRDPLGWPPLREALARALLARGIRCTADEVAVVNGAQHALDLVARNLVDPGETVVMEQPGYFGAAIAFAAAEAHVVGVGVDDEGLRSDELARILRARRVKLVFTTPAVQSPTGVMMSSQRRRALLALADEYQVPLLEDDYDSELRYGGPPLPALKTEDAAGQVIYVGTFDKALFGGIRVGYVVASPPLLLRLALSRWASDMQTNLVTQAALAELLASGAFERHVRRVRAVYAARRAALLAALARHMPRGTRWVEPAGGNAVWVTLPASRDGATLAARALEAGVAYTRGEAFFLDGGGAQHLHLCFAALEPSRIEEGVARLGELLRAPRRRSE
jgi:DNA-binding transcriptional MocR family regulator